MESSGFNIEENGGMMNDGNREDKHDDNAGIKPNNTNEEVEKVIEVMASSEVCKATTDAQNDANRNITIEIDGDSANIVVNETNNHVNQNVAKTYAHMVLNGDNAVNNKLIFRPTEINEDGNEYVYDCLDMSNRQRKTDYARVLLEFDVKKGFKEKIAIQYKDKDNVIRGTKIVNVEYAWKLEICTHCQVFGHDFKECGKRPKSSEEIEAEKNHNAQKMMNQDKSHVNMKNENEGNKSVDGRREWKVTKVAMEGVKTSNNFASLQEEYNIEFPAIPTSQNQYAFLIEEYVRKTDLILLFQKEEDLVEKLVYNKRIPTIDETKI
ncbi:hypothetical protein CTI12_AA572880 [Artemisia annua]|uniref:Zinc knuckle CX2CX4HX4C n=1 Tax=Artemisia annua TaxID=35608 RepID=A0A2U1KRD9_ARTAN|nr:hypothetical protein CTI12_AA572880 [Artemisia annua]